MIINGNTKGRHLLKTKEMLDNKILFTNLEIVTTLKFEYYDKDGRLQEWDYIHQNINVTKQFESL